jgi:hypothetical protein
MSIKITNLTSRPVSISLSSGTTLRLSPGQTSGKLRDVEIENNPKIDKLQEQRMIEVTQTQQNKAEAVQTQGEHAEAKVEKSTRQAGEGEGQESTPPKKQAGSAK